MINAAVDTSRPAADAKEIRVQVVLDFGAGMVLGDPVRLQQVVWNLLSNAIKFTPKHGRVQVQLERINSHLEIAVSDTGPGIEEEFLPHVFERFRQADSSITRNMEDWGSVWRSCATWSSCTGGPWRPATGRMGREPSSW